MTVDQITGPQAVELLRRAVAEKGRNHIPASPRGGTGCYYRLFDEYDDGEYVYPKGEPVPICGVGHAFHYAGILGKISGVFNSTTVGALQLEELTTPAAQVFGVFQDAQDSQFTWGQALDKAEAFAVKQGILTAPVPA